MKSKKLIILILLAVVSGALLIGLLIAHIINDNSRSITIDDLYKRGVIIDAGHGGSDPGAIAFDESYESDMNLEYALCLKTILESEGIPVDLMRSDKDAMAPTKDEDMAKRRELIHSSNAAVMVSIHMNSFTENRQVFGPQIFYQENSVDGEKMARVIQQHLNRISGGTRQCSDDRLYVLNGNPMPSVLVECGFISNPDELVKLQDKQYMKELMQGVVDGIIEYAKG